MKKRYIITGATGEIGRALITRLVTLEDTEWVVALGRNIHFLEELTKISTLVLVRQVDLMCDDISLETICVEGIQPNVFIHCAAEFQKVSCFENISPSLELETYTVKVFAWKRIASLLLPKMKEENDGKIISLSSRSGILPYKYRTSYAGANAALNHETSSLSLELNQYSGVHTYAVCPGPILGIRLESIVLERSKFTGKSHRKTSRSFYKGVLSNASVIEVITSLATTQEKRNTIVLFK